MLSSFLSRAVPGAVPPTPPPPLAVFAPADASLYRLVEEHPFAEFTGHTADILDICWSPVGSELGGGEEGRRRKRGWKAKKEGKKLAERGEETREWERSH